MGPVRKFLELSPAERRFLITAWLWLVFFRVALGLLPFQKVNMLLGWMFKNIDSRPEGSPEAVERVAAAIRRASRLVPQATCLPQALAAVAMLKRLGLPAELNIGVAKDEAGRFQAHAWAGCEGILVAGGSTTEYTPLWTWESDEI